MSWPALKSHLSQILGSEHHAAIFLGTVLAYPLHQLLRDHFAMVPAAWIVSRDTGIPACSSSSNRSDRSVPSAGSDRSLPNLPDLVHAIYHPSASDPDFHFADTTTTQAIIARHAAYPHCPWHMAFGRGTAPHFTTFLENACDMGVITRGVYGTRTFAVDRAAPPLITSKNPPADPDLAARYLTFRTSSTDQPDPSNPPDRTDLSLILPHLLQTRKWSTKTIRIAHDIERLLSYNTAGIPIRRRLQLAAAAATYIAADQLLTSITPPQGSISPPDLTGFLSSNPTAFEPHPTLSPS